MAQFILHDVIDDAGDIFPFSDPLEFEYFKKYNEAEMCFLKRVQNLFPPKLQL